MEFLKGECSKTSSHGQPCTECKAGGWISPLISRIPRPVPDATKLPDYHCNKMCLSLAGVKVIIHTS